MTLRRLVPILVVMMAVAASAQDARTPAPDGAEVYFIEPKDGTTVSGPVRVVFGLRGMGVAPAGIAAPKTGHHHLLVDTTLADPSAPIPSDANHIHFGAGQTETVVELAPGRHTLQLVLGDHLHRPHRPPVTSRRITIVVE